MASSERLTDGGTGLHHRVVPGSSSAGVAPRLSGATLFTLLAFGISWGLWVVAAIAAGPLRELTLAAGTFGPAVAALVVLGREDGRSAVRHGMAKLVRLRGAGRATGLAAVAPVGLAAMAVGVDRALGGETVIEWPPLWAVPVVVVYVLVLGGPLGEELGWRGYLLPRLEERTGALVATLVLAAVWTVWHLPLFSISGTVQTLVPLWLFAVQIFVLSFVYTWLVHRVRHSLAPALALHTSSNVTVGLVLLQPPDAPAARPMLLALLAAAILALALARTATFRSSGASVASWVGPRAQAVDEDRTPPTAS